jgi:hypothetical protein
MARVVTNVSDRYSDENYIWRSMTGGENYSTFNAYSLPGVQQAQQYAQQQQQKGKVWGVLDKALDFAQNIIGGRNQSTNVTVPADPAGPEKKGLGVGGWIAIAAGVGLLGFVIYKVAKK